MNKISLKPNPGILSNKATTIWLIFLVIFVNLILLRDFWGYGVIGEDWLFLLNFKTEHNTSNIFLKIFKFWTQSKAHWGTQISYLGILDQLFPSNYIVIQILNVVGKVAMTILIFPLIFILTKNKLLAFLSSIFFAVHYSSFGSLQQYANGVEYWAISFLILFILTYRKIVIKEDYNPFRLLTSSILLYLALSFGLYRLNGFIVILAIIEGVLFLTKKTSRVSSLFRIAFFIVIPVTIVFLVHHPTIGRENLPSAMMNHVLNGNWFIFINPLSGLALTFIPRSFLGGLDLIILQSPAAYLSYTTRNFTVPFIFVVLVIGYLLPLKTKRFIVYSVILACIFLAILFLAISHYTSFPRYDVIPAAIVGAFILALSISLGIEWWLSHPKNLLLFTSFVSLHISLFFTSVTWILNINRDGSITYDESLHRYLTVPAIGAAIFTGSIVTLIIRSKFNSQLKRVVGYGFVLNLVTFLLFASNKELRVFKSLRSKGIDLDLQIKAQEAFYKKYVQNKGDIVIYYIPPHPLDIESNRIEKAISPDIINWLSYLRQYYLKGPDNEGLGCLMVLAFSWHQKEAIINEKGHQTSFYYPAICPVDRSKDGKNVYAENKLVTLTLDKLFSFTIQNGDIKNITEDVKKKIEQGASPDEIANNYK